MHRPEARSFRCKRPAITTGGSMNSSAFDRRVRLAYQLEDKRRRGPAGKKSGMANAVGPIHPIAIFELSLIGWLA